MSEKTSLLQSIPPVEKSSTGSGEISLLSRTRKDKSVNDRPGKQNDALSDDLSATKEAVTGREETQSAELHSSSEEVQSISLFQYVTYASFVSSFILAGFAAVVLFKKLSKLIDERFSACVKALAIGFAIVVLHGFFTTYLYASYLNDPSRSIPLVMTMALWVLLGPVVGYTARSLLARKEKPNRVAALFDGGFYAIIFGLSAFGISPSVTTNGALLLTITACFLVVVPMARSLTAYKVAAARHTELKEVSSKILLYVLLFLPALMPVIAVMHLLGMSDLLTLFLINFITIDFVLLSSVSIVITSGNFEPEPEPVNDAVESGQPKQASVATSHPQSSQTKGEKITTGNPDDPIIQFLNSEAENSKEESTAKEKKPTNAPRVQPPKRPAYPGLAAPKKPTPSGGKKPPNMPQKVKAPTKPKKRQ
ncbi:MAG: hypothetical protein GVY36_01985 [Verrucomicrobia bacterium]|jgi:NO-binding membrane sensor protein with MHYT domain|nr:hypothetical protein [Verrucomicrobiota bacterium]